MFLFLLLYIHVSIVILFSVLASVAQSDACPTGRGFSHHWVWQHSFMEIYMYHEIIYVVILTLLLVVSFWQKKMIVLYWITT